VDLRDAAMLSVTQSTHQCYDIQPELSLGQRESSFLFGSVRLMVKCAISIDAAADNQPQSYQPRERGDGSRAMVSDPQLLGADSAAIFERLEPQF